MSDILTRQRGVAEDTIALYSGDGKLKPGALVFTITDKLNEYDKEFDDHLKNYNQFRKNVINKFFGSPMVVAPSLAEIKKSVDELAAIKKSVDDLKLEDLQKSVNEGKTAVEDIKSDLPKIRERIDKVKIPHSVADIRNVVYVVKYGTLDWVKDTNNRIDFTPTVAGIYRFTLTTFSGDNFNIHDNIGGVGEEQTAVNTITQRLDVNFTWHIFILSSIRVVRVRSPITYMIEFVTNIPDED